MSTTSSNTTAANTTVVASSTKDTSAKMTFLVLAPATSEGYPTEQPMRSPSLASTTSTVSNPNEVLRPRSNSTLSTSSTGSTRLRFLKLGPVYFGGDPTVSDFVDLDE
jgi:hypothetical protein